METSKNPPFDLLTGSPVADNSADAGGCCGGGSCMCSMGADMGADTTDDRVADSVAESSKTAPDAGTEFLVTGMTCGHCVSSVTEEVSAIASVASVDVVLKKGGASRVTVHANGPLDTDAVRAAVEEAGYQLA